MRRGDCPDSPAVQAGQNGNGQSGALLRIGAGAQLIEKDQGFFIRHLPEGDNIGHMAGKCTQALLDALLIPDIREYLGEQRQFRVFRRGNVKACLSHQREETDGLQADRFAACVGAGDYEQVEVPSDPDIDRHYFFAVDQGVSCPVKIHDPFFIKIGSSGVHFLCQGSAREYEIQLRHKLNVRNQEFTLLCGGSA